MIIHLIGSMRHFDEDVVYLQAIDSVIKEHRSTLALNWFEAVRDRKKRNSQLESSLDWQEIVEDNLNAVSLADALIVEGSRFNYSQGYQTAFALAHDTPVLNLYRSSSPDYIDMPDKFFVSGLSNPLFQSKSYETEDDLKKIVVNFLKDIALKTVEIDVKLALDYSTSNYLDRLAARTGKSRNGLIKDIITKEASNER